MHWIIHGHVIVIMFCLDMLSRWGAHILIDFFSADEEPRAHEGLAQDEADISEFNYICLAALLSVAVIRWWFSRSPVHVQVCTWAILNTVCWSEPSCTEVMHSLFAEPTAAVRLDKIWEGRAAIRGCISILVMVQTHRKWQVIFLSPCGHSYTIANRVRLGEKH